MGIMYGLYNQNADEYLRSVKNIHLEERTSISYYPSYLKESLDNWLKQLRLIVKGLSYKIHIDSSLSGYAAEYKISRIEKLISDIIHVLEIYYEGNVWGATNVFRNEIGPLIEKKSLLQINQNFNFFRARHKDINKPFVTNDFLHVPFEKRGLIKTNRYSIPGFPSLYLGDTTYLCSKEIDAESISNTYFSRLVNIKPLQVVPITSIEEYERMVQKIHYEKVLDKFSLVNDYVDYYPLIFASTCKVLNRQDFFKPEYIIPQLLMEYVAANQSINGIKYPSSRLNLGDTVETYNYVFPIKTSKPEGYCDTLMSMFKITSPSSFEDELLSNYDQSLIRTMILDINGKILCGTNYEQSYSESIFGEIHKILLNKELKTIKN